MRTVREAGTLSLFRGRGITVTNGSGTNAIVSTEYLDNAGHTVLAEQFPVVGSASILSYTWQKFDTVGNRTESRQYSNTNGAVQLWATNFSSFDGLHRPITQTVRDGAPTTFGWDAAGNMTNRAMPGGLTWRASYNSASQPLITYIHPTGRGLARAIL